MDNLLGQMFSGNRLALSRLISRVEGRSHDLISVMTRIQERCGNAYKVGLTGPPGAGKSTLADRLISHLRRGGKKVGVVAIDPSSPFSGGAVLGDRIRMQQHAGDDGVFIRSLGSRGSHGGLSRATREVVKLYDAFGMDCVLVETVGVGQTELDVMELADTTVVLLTPESGDTVQTMKAGILEIADIFVVNKADRDGSARMQAELKGMLELDSRSVTSLHSAEMSPRWGVRGGESGFSPRLEPKHPALPVQGGLGGKKQAKGFHWEVPVLLVQADKDQGVRELLTAIEDHRAFLREQGRVGGDERKRRIALGEAKEIVLDEIRSKINELMNGRGARLVQNPYETAREFLESLEKKLWGRSSHSIRRRPRSSARSRPVPKKRSKRR